MSSSLHPLLKCAERIVTGRICLLTDLILFDLAYVVKLVSDRVTAIIDHVDGHVRLRVIAAQSCVGVHHLSYCLTLLILQLEAHVIWVGTKLPFEELLAFRDAPVEIETQLWEERAIHTSVRCI